MDEDPLRTGAIFQVDPNHPALRSPVPRLHARGTANAGAPSDLPAQLHRPSPQRAASSVTRTSFEELYRQSPMPKVIASGGRVRPSVPAFDAPSVARAQPARPRDSAERGTGHRAAAANISSPAATARSSPARSRSSQTKSTTLAEWSILRVADERDAAGEHFVVQGVDTQRDRERVVSSPIAVRAGPWQLVSESESMYKLEGKPEKGVMTAAVEKAFAQGLTKDWKRLLGGGAAQSVEDTVSDSGSDNEHVEAQKKPPRPPTEAEARAKARAIAAAQAKAARQARSSTEAQQRQATSSVMSSFEDVDAAARGQPVDSDISPSSTGGTRRQSLIVTKKGRAPPPAPAPAPKPRLQIPQAVVRAAERASLKAEEEAAAAEALKLDEMPVTSSGRRRVPPLPFWANSAIRRDRDFNVLSATSGREVLLTTGAKNERAVLQPGAAAAAALLPRATTDLQDRVEEAASGGASAAKDRRSSGGSKAGRGTSPSPIVPKKRKSRRSSTDGSSKKKKEKRRRKKEKEHPEDEERDQADGDDGEVDGEDGRAAAAASTHSVSSGTSSIKFMSVKELKAQLDEKGVDHSACIEKQDLVDLLRLYWGVVISRPKAAHAKGSKPKGTKKPAVDGPSKRITKNKKDKQVKPSSKSAKRRPASDESVTQSDEDAGNKQAGSRRVKKISAKAVSAADAAAVAADTVNADITSGRLDSHLEDDDDAVVPDSEEEEDEATASAPSVVRVQAVQDDRPKPTEPVAATRAAEQQHSEPENRTLSTSASDVEALKQEYFRVLGKKPRGRFQNSAEWLQQKVDEANAQSAETQPAEATRELSPSSKSPGPARDLAAAATAPSPAMTRPRRTPSKPARFQEDADVQIQTSSTASPAKQSQVQPDAADWSKAAQHALSAAFASTAPTRPNFWGAVSEKLVAAGHKFSAAECQAQYDARFGSPQGAGSARKKNQPASSSKKQRGKRSGASGTAEDEDDGTTSSFGSFIAAASEKAAAATKPPPRKGTMANRRRLRGMLEDADAAHDGDDLFNSPRALGRDGFVQKGDDGGRSRARGFSQKVEKADDDEDEQLEQDEPADQEHQEDEVKERPRRAVGAPTRFAEENIPTSRNWREVQAQKEAEEAAVAEAARLSTRTRRKSVEELLPKSPAAAGRATATATVNSAKSSTSDKQVDELQNKYEETLGKRPRGKLARYVPTFDSLFLAFERVIKGQLRGRFVSLLEGTAGVLDLQGSILVEDCHC